MDTIDLYRVFIRVAENGSFIRAAESLNKPTSTVSAAIRELESRLDTRLFHRTTRSVSLTLDGNVFYARCQDMLQGIEETENFFKQASNVVAGNIRVDVPGRVGSHIILPALPEFFKRHPAIEIDLGVTDRSVNLAEEGIDCAVRVGMLGNSGMVAKCIGYLNIINVASDGYVAAFGQPASPAELSKHIAVGFASPTSGRKERWEWMHRGEVKSTAVKSHLTVNSAEAYIAACQAGTGMIQIPAYDVQNLLSSGKLLEIMPKFRPRSLPVSILYPHRRHLSRAVRVFAEWLTPLLQKEMRLDA
ncbi:TPA: LysR family transcriptional regulator [Klebsiella variicola subsp. variicola]|uniref:LysR substrate-binding domain-containing protein n=1 Tax=Klebsiella variicola TaxID=244366 RepID=UPI000DADE5CF|nr:LysR family transcriptional regulator [Klebsiella variicola]NKD41456.1 LysR family transcriptional regulator [Escherichia coli]HCI6000454.1 LysR family transcriptional regulator [Klebsiella variicola subsp. variicola]EIY5102417.1 LysR family transcriptional regulator [Klebsiella variicola]MCH6141651.1 LysR family transcriptional regulator [Klebsiella variicola]MCH6176544.1 LysR family transcriptional regulator [Klebsiella variicola]